VKPRTIAIAVFALVLAMTGITDAFARAAHQADVRSDVSGAADALARDISDVIARETAAVDTLAAFVEVTKNDADHIEEEFPTFAQALRKSGETIRAVQLAPDSVIRYVHPLEGNEAALNLDLLADSDRRALLEPAIENGTTVVQGPVELVQGGLGVLVRRPIYNEDGSFWGFAAILLDWAEVAPRIELDPNSAVVAGARLPGTTTVLAGDPSAFANDPIVRTLRVGATDTVWEIAVRPNDGWPATAPMTHLIWIGGLLVALLAATAAYSLAVRPEALRREREKARKELAVAEARYQGVFQHAGVGILITDTSGKIISHNPAMRTLLNYPDDVPLEGVRTIDLVHPEDREGHKAMVKKLLSGERVVQNEIRVHGYAERWCRTNTTMVDGNGNGRLYIATVEDVTVRKSAESALASSESRFRQLFENAPIAIQRENYTTVFREFHELREEGVTDLRAYLNEYPGRLREILAKVLIIDANTAARELQGHLERSNGQLTLLDRLTDPSYDAFVETLSAIWDGRSYLEQSVETLGPDGKARFLDVRWSAPVIAGVPDYSNLMVTISDITELREAQSRLEDLIESKDRFLASVAHELRTPLTAVVGFAHELKDELKLYAEPEREEFRELIAFHSSELSHIIEDLLVWARGDIGEVRVNPEKIDLGSGVRRSLISSRGTQLVVDEPDGAVEAYADPSRLRQIVRNLSTNAIRYGGKDVKVCVRRAEGRALVEVSDNGPPMQAADMNRIFEPYTRSHSATPAHGSIGLGLTVSRSLARLQGGDLVCVRDGNYNVFRVSLPLAVEQMLVETNV